MGLFDLFWLEISFFFIYFLGVERLIGLFVILMIYIYLINVGDVLVFKGIVLVCFKDVMFKLVGISYMWL